MMHSYVRKERIWQSSFVIINPQTGNETGRLLEWIESMVDVVIGRDCSENLRILKRKISWRSKVEARGCVFRIWSKQISLGIERKWWVEILNTSRCAVRGRWGSIVWLAYVFMICISLHVSLRAEGRKR